MQGAAANTVVFAFAFACAFLLAGKRPVLALSTRVLLVLVIALAGAYTVVTDEPLHPIIGVATLIANLLFVCFGALDFARFRSGRL
jgi:hypothetical protein